MSFGFDGNEVLQRLEAEGAQEEEDEEEDDDEEDEEDDEDEEEGNDDGCGSDDDDDDDAPGGGGGRDGSHPHHPQSIAAWDQPPSPLDKVMILVFMML